VSNVPRYLRRDANSSSPGRRLRTREQEVAGSALAGLTSSRRGRPQKGRPRRSQPRTCPSPRQFFCAPSSAAVFSPKAQSALAADALEARGVRRPLERQTLRRRRAQRRRRRSGRTLRGLLHLHRLAAVALRVRRRRARALGRRRRLADADVLEAARAPRNCVALRTGSSSASRRHLPSCPAPRVHSELSSHCDSSERSKSAMRLA
jgi:hypothetical protein